MNIGYFSIAYGSTYAFVDWEGLKALPVADRTEHCIHVRSEDPIEILMDGRKGHGIVKKPGPPIDGERKNRQYLLHLTVHMQNGGPWFVPRPAAPARIYGIAVKIGVGHGHTIAPQGASSA
jgi:hypothetical protein